MCNRSVMSLSFLGLNPKINCSGSLNKMKLLQLGPAWIISILFICPRVHRGACDARSDTAAILQKGERRRVRLRNVFHYCAAIFSTAQREHHCWLRLASEWGKSSHWSCSACTVWVKISCYLKFSLADLFYFTETRLQSWEKCEIRQMGDPASLHWSLGARRLSGSHWTKGVSCSAVFLLSVCFVFQKKRQHEHEMTPNSETIVMAKLARWHCANIASAR